MVARFLDESLPPARLSLPLRNHLICLDIPPQYFRYTQNWPTISVLFYRLNFNGILISRSPSAHSFGELRLHCIKVFFLLFVIHFIFILYLRFFLTGSCPEGWEAVLLCFNHPSLLPSPFSSRITTL